MGMGNSLRYISFYRKMNNPSLVTLSLRYFKEYSSNVFSRNGFMNLHYRNHGLSKRETLATLPSVISFIYLYLI
jgi:hypothetical protein